MPVDINIGYTRLSPGDEAELRAEPELAKASIALLMELEDDANERGWDHPDNLSRLFYAFATPNGNEQVTIAAGFAPDLQAMFMQACELAGSVGGGVITLAEMLEDIVKEGDGSVAPPTPTGLEFMEFYGWGLALEGWGVPDSSDASRDDDLSQHPDRFEVRRVQLVARTGFLWSVERTRGKEPISFAEKLTSAAADVVGPVIHGLIRMTAAADVSAEVSL